MEKIILASGSPRRKDILNMLNIPFEVMASDVDETLPFNGKPQETVSILSLRKAAAVKDSITEPAIIIGADTLVYIDDEILGKPEDKAHAASMLEKLSGKTHTVYTGITIIFKGEDYEKSLSCVDSANVTFKTLSQEDISEYIASGEPFGKAGAYAIQGIGSLFIEKINGDFFTVVGMSPHVLGKLFQKEEINIFKLMK